MDPLLLGGIVAVLTILVLFSGVSVAIGLLIVSAGFLIVFDGPRSLELMPEILFGKLDKFLNISFRLTNTENTNNSSINGTGVNINC